MSPKIVTIGKNFKTKADVKKEPGENSGNNVITIIIRKNKNYPRWTKLTNELEGMWGIHSEHRMDLKYETKR